MYNTSTLLVYYMTKNLTSDIFVVMGQIIILACMSIRILKNLKYITNLQLNTICTHSIMHFVVYSLLFKLLSKFYLIAITDNLIHIFYVDKYISNLYIFERRKLT